MLSPWPIVVGYEIGDHKLDEQLLAGSDHS